MFKKIVSALVCLAISLPLWAVNVNIVTNYGSIKVDLNEQAAPKTVENFLRYVDDGFYSQTIFHRVMPGFMIQGGGFTQDMDRKTTRNAIAYEGENNLFNDRGTLAMARTNDPNSATSQFFINHVDNPFLNHGVRGYGYTVFGKVISGLDVVDRIAAVATKTVGPYQNVPIDTVVIERIERINDL